MLKTKGLPPKTSAADVVKEEKEGTEWVEYDRFISMEVDEAELYTTEITMPTL